MLNDFGNIPSESDFRDAMTVEPQEQDIDCSPEPLEPCETEEPYDGAGWPGDGSGTDDLADYNQNEADDYSGE